MAATQFANCNGTVFFTHIGQSNNFHFVKALEKLKDEMSSLGLSSFTQYCKEPCFVRLTQSMVSYTRAVVPHCTAALKMYSPELYHPIIDSITELLRIMTMCVGDALNNIRDAEKGNLTLVIRPCFPFALCCRTIIRNKFTKKDLNFYLNF